MILPCITCKFRTEKKEDFRIYVGCSEKEKHDKNFHYDDYFYHHTCDAYEKEDDSERR